jgi:hypothetical protein
MAFQGAVIRTGWLHKEGVTRKVRTRSLLDIFQRRYHQTFFEYDFTSKILTILHLSAAQTWKRRWFVLRSGDGIYYYSKQVRTLKSFEFILQYSSFS